LNSHNKNLIEKLKKKIIITPKNAKENREEREEKGERFHLGEERTC